MSVVAIGNALGDEAQAAQEEMDRVDLGVAVLRSRARDLRRQAQTLHPALAVAYKRRAAELELHAWAVTLRTGREVVDLPGAAA
jgi:hypothetical protein